MEHGIKVLEAVMKAAVVVLCELRPSLSFKQRSMWPSVLDQRRIDLD